MKLFRKIIPTIISIIILITVIITNTISNYAFERDYLQEWNLADKSSTLTDKQVHVDKFVSLLESGYSKGEFSPNNAIFLKTPNNSFQSNLNALKTLQTRLKDLEGMDPNSFQYNTAIQQITAQEQGEAHAMLDVFEGCYKLKNYPIVWDWIENVLIGIAVIISASVFIFILIATI